MRCIGCPLSLWLAAVLANNCIFLHGFSTGVQHRVQYCRVFFINIPHESPHMQERRKVQFNTHVAMKGLDCSA